ncbi:MAG: TolC family protein [Planctomycetaceae bacterium]
MLLVSAIFFGCTAASPEVWETTVGNDTTAVDRITSQIDSAKPEIFEVSQSVEPVTAFTIENLTEDSYRDMDLNAVLRTAMENSTVLRDIGGVVLRSPGTTTTRYTSQLQETDPRFGMEAALSAFDAQLAASAAFNNNNRLFNNTFFAGGTRAFSQDLNDYQIELSKLTATGSRVALRGVANYDANNAPANTFASAWQSWLEGEIRQPLLQGGGLEFNRIAGPGGTPGIYNGILIAKVNNDVNNADFTVALRDYVSNIENAYWDLYLAYRELDARKKAMEHALITWNSRKATEQNTQDLSEESLARHQYFQFKSEVDEALSGRLLQGTQTRNGSKGGTLQSTGGVLTAERRLRLLIGLPASDGMLLRPSEEPTMAQIHFDWQSGSQEALTQRPELARQQLIVKKSEMELLAARNFLNPRLDAFGRYRFRGFGHDLIANGFQGGTEPASALGNLVTGDQQEWALGVELTVPIGYRQAHAAVSNAELSLARARAIQREQQREVISDLSGAIADSARAYVAVQNNLNQYLAAQEYLKALTVRSNQRIDVDVDRLLDAQRRVVESEIRFFRSRAEYAVALKNIHYEKASLLSYRDLRLNDTEPVIAEPLPVGGEVFFDDVVPGEPPVEIPAEDGPSEAVPAPDSTPAPDAAADDSQPAQKQPAIAVEEMLHAIRQRREKKSRGSRIAGGVADLAGKTVASAAWAATAREMDPATTSQVVPDISLTSDVGKFSPLPGNDDEPAVGAMTPISLTPISLSREVILKPEPAGQENRQPSAEPPVIGEFTPLPQ